MTKTSLKKKFIPLGSWAPDAPEFALGFLDQIVNAIPVFGVHRVIQSLHDHSVCPDESTSVHDAKRRVTGTYVHRISLETSLDILQPDYSEPQLQSYPPKEGFQTIPSTPGYQYYQALRGVTADASSTVLLIPYTTERILYGTFSRAKKVWNSVDPLILTIQFRIATGFVGNYDFTIEIGTTTNPTNPASFTPLTPPALINKAGLLQDDNLGGANQSDTKEIPNSSFSDPGNALTFAWRIKQTMNEAATTIRKGYNVVKVEGAAPQDRNTGRVTGWSWVSGTLPSDSPPNKGDDIATVIKGVVSDVWTPVSTDYVESLPVFATQSGGQSFYMRFDLPQFRNLQQHKIQLSYSATSTAQKLDLRLFQGLPRDNPRAFLIQEWKGIGVDHDGLPPYNPPNGLILNDLQQVIQYSDHVGGLAAITNWKDVWLQILANRPSGSATLTDYFLKPLRDFVESAGSGTWTVVGTGAIAAISDGSNATGIRQPTGATLPTFFDVRLDPYGGTADTVASLTAVIRGANSTGNTFARITLTDGLTGNFWRSTIFLIPQNDGTVNDYQLAVPLSAISGFNRFNNVIMKVEVTASSSGRLDVTDIYVRLASGNSSSIKLHDIAWFAPGEGENSSGAPIDVSWIRLDGPADTETNAADSLRAYIGTVEVPESTTQKGKIFEVDSPKFSEWIDVSKTGGYASNKRDKSFSFTGFGSAVMATNYKDPVQVKYETDSRFYDLIGYDVAHTAITDYGTMGGVYPRARFCATISAFLCLANIDPLSVVGTGQPYTFWCSRYAQPQYFHIGLIEWQSSVFQMTGTPGEITALVGGEYGLIFKENSITRMDYAGLPEIFHPTQISGKQGTVQPRSIVQVEDDVYFWGGGGIYVVRHGTQVEEIAAQGEVRKFLFDTQFEKFSLSTVSPGLETEASSRVVGGYEVNTGCVIWAYMSKMASTDWFMCDSLLIYSPREDKFTFAHGKEVENFLFSNQGRIISASDAFATNDLKIQGFLEFGNRAVSGETYLMRTLFAVNDIPPRVSSFSDKPVYPQMFRSNTISSSFFQAPLGVEMEIQRVRPITAVEQVSAILPEHTIHIEANQSPAIGDGTGKVVVLESKNANKDGWIDVGVPLSGEFFKIATIFNEKTDQIMKEVLGWQLVYRLSGDQ